MGLALIASAVAAEPAGGTSSFRSTLDYVFRWFVCLAAAAIVANQLWNWLEKFRQSLEDPDAKKSALWVESHWGGLGGGLGGWRVSNALVYLLVTVVLAALTVAILVGMAPTRSDTNPIATPKAEEKKEKTTETKKDDPAPDPTPEEKTKSGN